MTGTALCKLSSGSTLGAALSLAVTTMGAGILTLPSAYADAGVLFASFLLTFVAVLTVYSVDYIIQAVDKLGLNSYEEITRELLGRKAEEVVRWMLLIYNTGSAIGYLVVIGDLFEPMQPIISAHFPLLSTPKHTLVCFWLLVILPLSCVPKLGALHFTSFLAIFATSVISLMIVYRFFVPGPSSAYYRLPRETTTSSTTSNGGSNNNNNNNSFLEPITRGHVSWWWGRNPLLSLPIIMFSFDCQSLVFQIYANLDDMRRRTMFTVSIISLTVSGIIHAAVGLFGYLTNPLDVKDNVISNYDPNKDALFAVGYSIYAIPINLAFVLLLFPIRDSIFIMWYGFSSASVATHVPRRRDFTRLVDEEERLEEQLTKLEEHHHHTHHHTHSRHRREEEGEDEEAAAGEETACTAVRIRSNGHGSSTTTSTALRGKKQQNTKKEDGDDDDNDALSSSKRRNNTNHLNSGGSSSSSGSNDDSDDDGPRVLAVLNEQQHVIHQKKQQNEIEVIPLRDHLIVSVTLSTVCVAMALVMPGIVSVVALLGGICSSTLCFTCPALYRWALNRRGLSKYRSRVDWLLMAFMLLFGVVAGTLGTTVAIKSSFFG